ncbi:MAG: pitrilysin family protein [bacterium]
MTSRIDPSSTVRNLFSLRAIATWMVLVVAAGAYADSWTEARDGNTTSLIARRPEALKSVDLKFAPIHPSRHTLKNGMVVYLHEDHELPLANATVYFRAGTIYDPPDKIGVAELTGEVMRSGGTDKATGDELDERLEFLSASVETSISRENGKVSISALKKDLDEVLGIVADVLRRPAFSDDKIDLARKGLLEEIRRQNDEPAEIARREFSYLVYGKRSPWAWRPTVASVERITRDDLVAYHKKYVCPRMILGFSGDFESEKLLAKLESLFGDWPKSDSPLPEVEKISRDLKTGVYYVDKDINQTHLWFGHLGIPRHTPDEYAVTLMNQIYGKSFLSRLVKEVRSDRGLAYSTAGYITEGTDVGIFFSAAQTKAATTGVALDVMLDVLNGMRGGLVTEDELDRARQSEMNSFVFNYDSSAKLVSQAVANEYFSYPSDYLDHYLDNIRAVTREDILRVARQDLHPDSMVILLVGNQALFDKPLSSYDHVTTLTLDQAQ